jgi:hypothetical protein
VRARHEALVYEPVSAVETVARGVEGVLGKSTEMPSADMKSGNVHSAEPQSAATNAQAAEMATTEMHPTAAEAQAATAAAKVHPTAATAAAVAAEVHATATATAEVRSASASAEMATTTTTTAAEGVGGQWCRDGHCGCQQDCTNSISAACHRIPPGRHCERRRSAVEHWTLQRPRASAALCGRRHRPFAGLVVRPLGFTSARTSRNQWQIAGAPL